MIAKSNATDDSIRKAVEQAFTKFDKDHNGTLEFDECIAMSNEIFKYHAHGLSDKEIRGIFDQVDIRKDGHITKEEFISYLKKLYGVK